MSEQAFDMRAQLDHWQVEAAGWKREAEKLEAKLAEAEAALAAVKAERDRYKAVAGAYMGEWGGPRAKAENIRYWIRVLDMANEAEEMARALAWEALADHLEA